MDWLNVCCFVGMFTFLERGFKYRAPLFGPWKSFWTACVGRPLCLLSMLICWVVALALCLKGCDLSWTQVVSWLASLEKPK